MSQRRVCDACAVRRVRCDGQAPCAGCMNASLNCTRLRQRHKSGPKGIKKRTLEKLTSIQQAHVVSRDAGSEAVRPPSVDNVDATPTSESQQKQPGHVEPSNDGDAIQIPPGTDSQAFLGSDDYQTILPQHDTDAIWEPSQAYPYTVGVDHLALYLDIYHHKLYPVWPIVNKANLIERLNVAVPNVEAYILASSVCVATILQLQLTATDPTGIVLQPRSMIQEIEALRQVQDYREHPTLDNLRASFFLHVAYLHVQKQRTSTLTLREAISMAHMLDLHRESHYKTPSNDEGSDKLRLLWLLFITERYARRSMSKLTHPAYRCADLTSHRAHALQYDLPCTLNMPSDMPMPRADAAPFTLSAFISLCSMFKALAEASTNTSQSALEVSYRQLLQLPDPIQDYNQLQKADVGVTQHWMKLHLWKLAVSRIQMTTEPGGDITSVLFPLQVVRELLTEVSALSVDSLEAHGSGMELKLFEFANTMADVMVCMPHRWTQDTRIGPREYLTHLGKVLGGFRGGNEALLPLLRSRFTELGLFLPTVPRIIDVTYESSGSSPTRFTHAGDRAVDWVVEELAEENEVWPHATGVDEGLGRSHAADDMV